MSRRLRYRQVLLEGASAGAGDRPVVVVGQLPPPVHGSAVMTQRLVRALGRTGRRVDVVDRRFSRSAGEVGALSLRKLIAVPSLILRFVRATRGDAPVVVLITTRPATFLLDVLLLALARRPAVLYVHTVGFRALARRGRIWRSLVRRALERASRVVVLGDSLVEDVAPFVPRERIGVVPNCTDDVEPFQHHAGARLLFLSNLLPGKGADAFVRLAARLREERPLVDWSFDVAGEGDPSVLPPLPEGVVLHGRVAGDRKARLLQSADLLVLPSTYAMEAQPLVIVEALAHGLPVVAYDNGGIRDLVDASVGALVPVGDEQLLLSAVLRLSDDSEHLLELRRAASERHRDRHSIAAYDRAWRSVMEIDGTPRTDLRDAAAGGPR